MSHDSLEELEARLATRYGEVVTIRADVAMALLAEVRTVRDRLERLQNVAKAAKEYRRLMQQPGGANLTEVWQALCASLDELERFRILRAWDQAAKRET